MYILNSGVEGQFAVQRRDHRNETFAATEQERATMREICFLHVAQRGFFWTWREHVLTTDIAVLVVRREDTINFPVIFSLS